MTDDKNIDMRYAVLIDADNIAGKYIKTIMDEVSNYGTATYRRIYGDWTNPNLEGWKKYLLENSIIPVQQYGYTTGKNSTDAAMIIDAMDILYSGNIDGLCLVTSDSDFTRLAARLRESGMDVTGMGEQKTPRAFIAACNKFKYLDLIYSERREVAAAAEKREKEASVLSSLEELKETIVDLVEENSDEDGWMFTGNLGNILSKRYPDFDVRNFGYTKLTPFIKSLDLFEVKAHRVGNNNKLIYIRKK